MDFSHTNDSFGLTQNKDYLVASNLLAGNFGISALYLEKEIVLKNQRANYKFNERQFDYG